MKNLVAFGWFGGKQYQLPRLLPLFPRRGVNHFVDVFGGSASVIMNVTPYPVETYNDINQDVVHFFRTLRDWPDELIRVIQLTPYSRDEFALACKREKCLDEIEQARRFYVATQQAIASIGTRAVAGNWSYTKVHGKAKNSLTWANGMEKFWPIVHRFRAIQVENRPALDVIRRLDAGTTLFYCDPPYVLSTRTGGKGYADEMTDDDHRELATALNGIKGRAVVSGYHSPLYDEIYEGWEVIDLGKPIATRSAAVGCGDNMPRRQEVVWCNFKPDRERLL